MGKVSPQDFDEMAARLRARALGIMTQLDAGAKVYRELIEKELAARTGKAVTAADRPPARAVETPDPKVGPTSAGSPLCACGTANDSDARFCKSCGAKLQVAS